MADDDDYGGSEHLKNFMSEAQTVNREAKGDKYGGMKPVPGQAKMGNYLGDKGNANSMPYGPLEGVRGADGKDRYSQYPNSKYKSKP